METKSLTIQKDEILDKLADRGNVAQFVAFRPDSHRLPQQSYSRVAGYERNHRFENTPEAISALIKASGEKSVNVRSYLPEDPRSKEFVYGLKTAEAAMEAVQRLSQEGLSTIVNETIDVTDGGVSGVVQGDTMEFSPDDTPRCVEKPGVLSLAFAQGIELLKKVYGFSPDLLNNSGERTEFSIHPKARGWKSNHTVLWEHEENTVAPSSVETLWPNNFSRFIGDKAFGLLVADGLGIPVPRTLVISRRVAPFTFGLHTGSSEVWIRTCPTEPQPGLYTTAKGWLDPFKLLALEDPSGNGISSVLRQDAVHAAWSGAAIAGPDGAIAIEGVPGEGDRLMLGLDSPSKLPSNVISDVENMYGDLQRTLGHVRIEWVHDGVRTWCVQLHIGQTHSQGSTIVPGEAATWVEIRADEGLSAIREQLASLSKENGVLLIGNVGVTSHIADLLRKRGGPSRIVQATSV